MTTWTEKALPSVPYFLPPFADGDCGRKCNQRCHISDDDDKRREKCTAKVLDRRGK